MSKKIGIIDVGGGMRDIYGAGVFDYLMEEDIEIPYCIGVSAGSANVGSYVAKQKGRNYKFYTKYNLEKKAMSMSNLVKNKSYINLDYIYGTISNEDGKCPWDFDKAMKSKQELVVVASDANTGKPVYFTKKDYVKNDYGMFKGSSCIPIFCKPYNWKGYALYDGGCTDPIPYRKALEDGCDRFIVVLTRPLDFRKHTDNAAIIAKWGKKHPNFVEKLFSRCDLYNVQLEHILDKYVKENKALVIGPEDTFGIDTLTKDKEALKKLYNLGKEDGEKIKDFLNKNN